MIKAPSEPCVRRSRGNAYSDTSNIRVETTLAAAILNVNNSSLVRHGRNSDVNPCRLECHTFRPLIAKNSMTSCSLPPIRV